MPSPQPLSEPTGRQGIRIAAPSAGVLQTERQAACDILQTLGLAPYVQAVPDGPCAVHFEPTPALLALAPQRDTTVLCAALGLDTEARADDLAREILLAMLLGPVAFPFPSAAEMHSAVRIRQHIVQAARKTALAFDTEQAERPAGYWRYDEARGFTIEPGVSLIDALQKATQPDASGKLYSFSCYRATEYVTLLGIALELRDAHPALYASLQRQWETRAVMSGQFHDVFLREYGSMDAPLPSRYYVPGDRLWFRNPDAHSSNVEGYEGSWVFYLGSGLFNNFWKRDQPYTLTAKCVEIFHWRNGARRDAQGRLVLDEAIVEARVARTLADPAAVQAILARMLRRRDPQGVYAEGGCIDATRECAQWILPGTAQIVLPDGAAP
ncbi:hypothetical protein [Bordetella sp. BOR01]|uniref:hypothetical protein n=1 Tax=Bordetella sp. BOR01 TaxID=2854779 RepID=UPI0021029B76|nr:hypothetical protein [Bordetella sp. BOR01]